MLPPAVRDACAAVASTVPRRELARAAGVLSERYRAASADPAAVDASVRSREEAVASLVTRFPATYAACARAAGLVGEEMGGFRPERLVDVGAGTGASALAVTGRWPSVRAVCLVEASPVVSNVGRELLGRLGLEKETGWVWEPPSDRRSAPVPSAELVVMSYVAGEQAPDHLEAFVARWWETCIGLLLVVEPGTPAGFRRVARVREWLITTGEGHVVAPCPHDAACPLARPALPAPPAPPAEDWCHFAVRLPRSAEHRQLKGGRLAYEDEKFSFVAVAREATWRAVSRPAARIIRRPARARRRVDLTLCAVDGLSQETVPQSSASYRAATKAEWGDPWPPPQARPSAH